MSLLIANIAHGLTGALGAEGRFAGAIRVEGTRIAEMGDLEPRPGERVIDAGGALVCPATVNAHHHLFQSLLKGVPAGLDLPLDPWLAAVPWSWWPWIDETAFRISARVGLTELALTGTGTVCDHHYFYPESWEFDPDAILFEEAAALGLRLVLARGGGTKGRSFPDGSVPPPPTETLDAFLAGVTRAAARFHDPAPDAMTRVACAPTTPVFNLDPGELAEVAQAARALGLRLHSHLSENEGYAAATLARHGERPVPWLAGRDWLGPDVWFAHLVDVDASEVALLAETGTGLAHCPQANARLGSGVAPAPALFEAGAPVGLAVDGAAANEAADMPAEMHAAFLMHRARGGAGAVAAGTVMHWATMGGAAVLGLPSVGRIAPGMAADIAVIGLDHPRHMGLHDPALAPVITGAAPVRHLLVAGREVVRDGALPGLDLSDLAEAARGAVAAMTFRQKQGAAARLPAHA